MKKTYRTDIFLIALGLATLVAQRFFLDTEKTDQKDREYATLRGKGQLRAEVGQEPIRAQVVREPECKLTVPAGSKYQTFTPPPGVTPNPFQEVQRIVEANKQVRNYAGKDTDMRQLLLAHAGKDYLFVLQQQAANEMLRHELFPHYYVDPTQAEVLEAISFYTEQLVEAKSEDAKLMYMCLRALKDTWPEQKIARVALSTAERVQARKIQSAADTATVAGYHRQVYARELKKLGNKLKNRA